MTAGILFLAGMRQLNLLDTTTCSLGLILIICVDIASSHNFVKDLFAIQKLGVNIRNQSRYLREARNFQAVHAVVEETIHGNGWKLESAHISSIFSFCPLSPDFMISAWFMIGAIDGSRRPSDASGTFWSGTSPANAEQYGKLLA
jgi:hypothetical protein